MCVPDATTVPVASLTDVLGLSRFFSKFEFSIRSKIVSVFLIRS